MQQANTVKPTGWAFGRSKMIVASWEQKMKWVNISNQPLTITMYTLRLKQNIPQDFMGQDLSSTSSLLDLMIQWFQQQYADLTGDYNRTVRHPAFKLTDIAQWSKFFRIAKTSTFKIMPGDMKTMRKFRNKPQMINTAGLFNTQTSPAWNNVNWIAMKGERHYLWKVHSMQVDNEGDSGACRISPAYNFETFYHYRFSWLAHDEYNFQVAAVPHTGDANYRVIFPGTSTKGALAPAN